MSNSTHKTRSRKAAIDKPPKPYKDFPLTPHNSGAWMKKIRGSIYYFGKWGRRVNGVLVRIRPDGCWQQALEIYKAQADDLHAGRTPRTTTGDLTVAALCNQFLTAKLRKLEAREITDRTFAEYKQTCDMIVAAFGSNRRVDDLAADDFGNLRASMAEKWGPVRLAKMITCTKGVFKFGIDNGLIEKAVRFGSEFNKPGKAVLRRHKAANGTCMFEADECRRLLAAADDDVQMQCMVLLALNAGYGPHRRAHPRRRGRPPMWRWFAPRCCATG